MDARASGEGQVSAATSLPRPDTTLVLRPDEREALTAVQKTDVRTALTRGLAEYLLQLSFEAIGGRRVAFRKVVDTWADAEERVMYPYAVVQAPGEGNYDAVSFTPHVDADQFLPLPDGRFLVRLSEFTANLTVEVWANDIEERMALMAMLERDLSPVDWMYGVRLRLPHYFNVHASYEPGPSSYTDSDEEAIKRYRKATVRVSAACAVIRLSTFPAAKPWLKVNVAESNFVE